MALMRPGQRSRSNSNNNSQQHQIQQNELPQKAEKRKISPLSSLRKSKIESSETISKPLTKASPVTKSKALRNDKVSMLEVYLAKAVEFLVRPDFLTMQKYLSPLAIKTTSGALYTKSSVCSVFTLLDVPEWLDYGALGDIKLGSPTARLRLEFWPSDFNYDVNSKETEYLEAQWKARDIPEYRRQLKSKTLLERVRAYNMTVILKLYSSGESHSTLKSNLKNELRTLNIRAVELTDVENAFVSYSIASRRPTDINSKIFPVIMTPANIAEQIPLKSGSTNSAGVILGKDIDSNSLEAYELRTTDTAKGIIVVGPAGSGKTAEVAYIAMNSIVAGKIRLSISNFKTEYNNLLNDLNAYRVDMTQTSRAFFNPFKLSTDLAKKIGDAEEIHAMHVNAAIFLLSTIANFSGKLDSTDDLIADFVNFLFEKANVEVNNANSWAKTADYSVKSVYNIYCDYARGTELLATFDTKVVIGVQRALKTHFDGTLSYLYQTEINPSDVLDNKALSFDYGNSHNLNPQIATIKYASEKLMRSLYYRYNCSNDVYTLSINEEMQSVSERIRESAIEDATLRRAMKVIPIYITASPIIMTQPEFEKLADSINIVLVGSSVSRNSRVALEKTYDLLSLNKLESNAHNTQYSFYYYNKHTKKSTILVAPLPKDFKYYK